MDIENRIGELAASFVPEWHFDREDPDIGSVIAKVFAGQMAGNIGRYNQVLDKYHTEFVNMLGISLLPAQPASAVVLMNLVQDTIPGVDVPKGTKLLAESVDEGEPVIFETTHDLFVTSAEVNHVFMTLEKDGRIIPLKGYFRKPELIDGEITLEGPAAAEDEEMEESEAFGLKPFRLFCGDQAGIQQNALIFYHDIILNVENNPIYIKICGNPKLVEEIQNENFQFQYLSENGLIPVEECQVLPDGETIVLKKMEPCIPAQVDGRAYSVLVLMAKGPVKEEISLTSFQAASAGVETAFEAVNNGTTDFDTEAFEPFGDTLSLFQECYLGHDGYFRKAGARVRIGFDVVYGENRMLINVKEEEAELKVIKRKPRVVPIDTMAEVRAEEISLEYFNGIGWKKLNCDQETRKLFSGDRAGRMEISFICPDDWEEIGAGAYQGRCIRMQLLKADNCYMRPGIHHYPKLKHVTVSYSYEERYLDAQRLISLAGTKKRDLTRFVKEGKRFSAFSGNGYDGDALYLGFTKKIEHGPISILFQMEDAFRFEGTGCRIEYSTSQGFKQMKVMDFTSGMSRSGAVMFLPPADMQMVTLENKNAYWIRVFRERPAQGKEESLPVIRDIRFNAVLVSNVETRAEEDFYLDEIKPDMQINLGVSNILDVDVWVNEKGRHSRSQMLQMIQEMPDNVRAEYDMIGDISAFFIRWQEADQLDDVPSRRCYMLDRMNNVIIFGDGNQVDIPRVIDDVAFKATIRCCSGAEGNVGPGQINESLGNLMFVDNIRNPVKAYGGSSMETIQNALRRGANILKSRNRLVSMEDYLEEIISYSDTIDQAACVVGRTIHGEINDSVLNFVLLMKDFEYGSYSFHNVAGMLKEHLLSRCELTVDPTELHIVEPIFARVSVTLWADVPQMEGSYKIMNYLQNELNRYLDPISDENGGGWKIGTMPKRSQFLMQLNMLKSRAIIKRMVITVTYTDRSGTHEVDLDDLKENPFMICCNGTHKINLSLAKH